MGETDGVCRLCGSRKSVLTREHIPAKSSGNTGPLQVETINPDSRDPIEIDLSDGFALTVLCDRCNSRYGSRLGTTFADFVQQIQKSGRFRTLRGGVFDCAMEVYPSRIYRQLLLNFLCIQPAADNNRWDPLRQFIRSREGEVPAQAPQIGLYYNISDTYRVVPVGVMGALGHRRPPWMGAEIAAPGLGVVYTVGDLEDVNPAIAPKLFDISSWGEYGFTSKTRVTMELARNRVLTPHPIAFGSRKDVDKWQKQNLIAWLATSVDTGAGSEIRGILWRPIRRRRK